MNAVQREFSSFYQGFVELLTSFHVVMSYNSPVSGLKPSAVDDSQRINSTLPQSEPSSAGDESVAGSFIAP
ncbi:MAG: hypothetical protein DKT66_09040 [Candidatus Melainabacteria bacterium]|nr:MAG: hypothetical protein DKT66_09040 [Candidatus Melainabacteria bacterium]